MQTESEAVGQCKALASLLMSLVMVSFVGYQGCHLLPPEKRLIIVLIDETESFALYDSKGTIEQMYWPEVIPMVGKIVDQLRPGDEFAVIGIDERGFDEEDVIIPFQVLDEGLLKAKMQKRTLAQAVGQLQPRRERHRSTHILGALYHAAHFAMTRPDRRTVIFCFSDMRQEPRMPTNEESDSLRFPTGSEGHFFYVDAAGRRNWDHIVGIWTPILNQSGLKIHSGNTLNFYQRGESDLRLGQILDALVE